MKQFRLLFLLAALSALAGCPTDSGPTYTVQGTIEVDIPTDPTISDVTVTQGSDSFTVTVPWTSFVTSYVYNYSIPGVPAGTYSASVSYTSAFSGFNADNRIDGGAWNFGNAVLESGGPVYAETLTLNNITVGADVQLEVIFNWL